MIYRQSRKEVDDENTGSTDIGKLAALRLSRCQNPESPAQHSRTQGCVGGWGHRRNSCRNFLLALGKRSMNKLPFPATSHALGCACVVLFCLGGAAGCASRSNPGSLDAIQKVTIGGQSFLVNRLTAGTWTVTAASGQSALPSGSGKTALVEAVEKLSGCKVTDSDYSRNGTQLDAQVDCAEIKS
jgi:hypothetical protein